MSHTDKIKTIQQVTRWQVMKLLNWNDQQYADFQFEQGYEYLKYWIGEDAFGFAELPLTSAYWAWWRNHWHKRDMSFVESAKQMSLNERLTRYHFIHKPETIQYSPQKAIMENAYAEMIYKVTHEGKGVKA